MQPRRPGFPARLDGQAPRSAPPAASQARAPRPPTPQGVGLDSAAVRARMVQRLAAGGIASPQVLQAMGGVERHRFVDTALANQAYEDTSLPIGLAQTISKPSVVARMIELLLGAECAREQGLGRVLEIGTGCGYQAAVLARVVREVYTIERLRPLHEKARDHLRPLRLANVHLILGDGMQGFPGGAPYAGIIAAAGGDNLPPAWCEQLAVGGRLVAPINAGSRQALMVVDRTAQGFKQSVLESVNFVPLKSGIA
ncbi:protein-L-isoaspartate(D-aspartate) O-methyltransferase [Pulveribacter sp.]|uniref:protein-L-isoaspartate(D-aspartate) O-methyltransferase n=1 Tax=Pulveribacter sp. TaxID=2678893 RepID=UPI00289C9681|nr:protein-L-isoaspartate(D-aspartate) O-methyltransferase [Pulveribacter sp.]